ncbi:excalibur calcium-binding domain-containing protein [Erythrobacter sp. F6033]|uniref:excalibur calcium-binding domain-containing protein n=1 Tax=Erythrobacter sp. F6033 TaxID=2926401 RepID=UPI001FF61508|nr:excalibur calcium-binding domain-containing protein [Erythrobacter sp. F6033]MCK0127539.1 excalibur calcium-binding domain-containing protein [Erythrobacter sp. F6033]
MREWGHSSDRAKASVRIEFAFLSIPLVIALVAALISIALPEPASAHPGGLASDGCHNDRKNGGRHCHQGKNAGKVVSKPAGGKTYYPNCAAARRAGATPILRGQSGYGRHLDRDGDGRACE